MVRFRLFGSIDLHDQNGSELRSVLAQPKRLALLAYLCITRELGPSRRDTIVGLFWPELDQDRARKALNKAVHFLRQELGDDVLASRSAEELAVDAEQLWCDVSGFNAAVKADDHATATELYRGDLLTGVFLEAGHEFDQWLDGERVRLRLAAARAARLLAQQHEQQGSLTLAVDMARRAVELSDGDERLFRELLALHDRVGDRAGAVRAYDAFAEQLAREYQTEPAPETQALIGRIRGRTEARAKAAELDFRPADEPRTASDESSVPSLVRPPRRRLPTYAAIGAVLLLVGTPFTWWVMSKGTVSPIQSLVVLPLDNLTADSAQEYFVQGMHEALIASLAQLSGRRIISRTSAMNYKGTTKSVPEIARELGVDAVVEGSVFRAGDSVRVQVQLIAARPERHIWTETYNRSLSDVLALHSEIAGTVAHHLTASMSDTAQQPLERARSPQRPKVVNLEAYDEFLRGQYHLARAPSTLESAIRHFQRSVALDSSSARAHAALSVSYWRFAQIHPEYVSRARVEARSALDLDPTLADAHVAVALARMSDWDWPGSEASFRQALTLNPSSSLARQWYAQLFRTTLRLEDAMREARRAIELDPFSLVIRAMEGWVLYNERRQNEALEVYRKVLELEPEYGLAIYNQGLSYWMLRRGDKVIESALRAKNARLPFGDPHASWLLSVGYALAGRPNEARATLDSLEARFGPALPYSWRAAVHQELKDDETALTLLEKALVLREPALPNLTSEPIFDRLRSHPRFRALRAAMRVP